MKKTVHSIIQNQWRKKESLKRNYFSEHIVVNKIRCYFGIGLYARIWPLYENGSIVIASVELPVNMQGKGIYKNFILEVEDYAYQNKMRVVIESILSEKLEVWTQKSGYTRYLDSNTYYKDFI